MKTGKTFQLGDRVKWWSAAGGGQADKVGEVVAIIRAGARPDNISGVGLSRNHESYVVRASATSDDNGRGQVRTKRPRLYWPRVSKLERCP